MENHFYFSEEDESYTMLLPLLLIRKEKSDYYEYLAVDLVELTAGDVIPVRFYTGEELDLNEPVSGLLSQEEDDDIFLFVPGEEIDSEDIEAVELLEKCYNLPNAIR